MRRFLLTCFVICFASVSLIAAVSVNLPCKEVLVNGSSESTVFKGTTLSATPGQPQLPVYNCAVLLPPDADPESVVFSISGISEETLEGSYTVLPAPPMVSCEKEWWPNQKSIVNRRDVSIYSANRYFPQRYISSVRIGKLRNYIIAKVTIHLAQYNPVTNTLKQLKNGTLTATWTKNAAYDALQSRAIKVPESTKEKVKSIVVNYNDVSSEYDEAYSFTTNTKYVIMTTEAIKNGSSKLNSFIESRERKGYTVDVITESTVGCPPNKFSPDSMRLWLQNNYQSQSIEYVLIIGCPHMTSGDVPMKTVPYMQGENAGTDFYFAQLSSDILDTADHHAEVDVGRIPLYYNDINTVDIVLERSMAYENESKQDIGWRNNAFLIADPLDSVTPGSRMFEKIKDDIYELAGWTYYRIYSDDYGTPDVFPSSYGAVGSAWNSNKFGFIQYITHGNSLLAANILNSNSVRQLSREYAPIVFQGTCDNGLPTDPRNLGHGVLKRCALSVITATEKAYYGIGQGEMIQEYPTMQGFEYGIARALVLDSLSSAKALNKVKSEVFYIGNFMVNLFVFTVYGVPDIGLYSSHTITPVLDNIKPVFSGKSIDIRYFRERFYYLVPDNGERVTRVKIDLYTIQGKHVSVLVDENKTIGAHNMSVERTFPGTLELAAGLYLCTMSVGDKTKVIHIVIK